jgi:hypothetical protein
MGSESNKRLLSIRSGHLRQRECHVSESNKRLLFMRATYFQPNSSSRFKILRGVRQLSRSTHSQSRPKVRLACRDGLIQPSRTSLSILLRQTWPAAARSYHRAGDNRPGESFEARRVPTAVRTRGSSNGASGSTNCKRQTSKSSKR